jgi:hypothetical protein
MPEKLSRATRNAQEWFQKLAMLFNASAGQNAYSHAAFFYTLKKTDDGGETPLADEQIFDDCVYDLAIRRKHFPLSLHSASSLRARRRRCS